MISELVFKAKMKELATLMNVNVKFEFVTEAYKRLGSGTYTEDDLSRATEQIMGGDHLRVTFPGLLMALNSARSLRFDKESQERQMRALSDRKMFWDKRQELVHEACLDRHCGSCEHEKHKYCEDVAYRTMALIKEKFSVGDCQWSINERLAKEFPGYGFEKIYGRHQWAKIIDGKPESCDSKGDVGVPHSIPKRRSYEEFINEDFLIEGERP